MTTTTQIAQQDWPAFFTRISNENQGRSLTLAVVDPNAGESGTHKQGKLMAIDYDPAGEGDDIVISTGVDELGYSHPIPHPTEVWSAEEGNGKVAALEIVDRSGAKSILRFSAA